MPRRLLLSDEDDVNPLDQVAEAMRNMQEIADLDPAFASIASELESAYYTLQDVQSDLARQVDDQTFDEGRLDDIEKRLELFLQLERKYGDSLPKVIAYGQKAAEEFANMEAFDADASDLEDQVAQQHGELLAVGAKLTKARKATAKALVDAIHQQLAALYMAKPFSQCNLRQWHTMQSVPDGLDVVEFYIQTNPGEAAKPLAKIASGGELSRIMLALKTIFAKSDGVTSIIFR
jgi:DNA repair protein RecN (Recombination protein N)